jgi:hypothetical protein
LNPVAAAVVSLVFFWWFDASRGLTTTQKVREGIENIPGKTLQWVAAGVKSGFSGLGKPSPFLGGRIS